MGAAQPLGGLAAAAEVGICYLAPIKANATYVTGKSILWYPPHDCSPKGKGELPSAVCSVGADPDAVVATAIHNAPRTHMLRRATSAHA